MPNINPKTTLLPEPAWIPQGEREEVPVVLPGPGRYNYRALPRRPVNQGFLFFAWRLDFPAPRGLTEWVPPEFCPNYYYHHRLCLYFWSQNRTPQKRFPEPPTSPPPTEWVPIARSIHRGGCHPQHSAHRRYAAAPPPSVLHARGPQKLQCLVI